MLNKENRICNGRDYKEIFEKGRKISGRYMIIFVLQNNREYNRFGIITSKKIGNAVIRNLAKRRLRAIITREWSKIKTGFDVVIVARASIKDVVFNLIARDFLIVMKKAGLC